MRVPTSIIKSMAAAGVTAAFIGGGAACGDLTDTGVGGAEGEIIGAALPGIDADELAGAKTAFNSIEDIADGVGPIFNEHACGTCHDQGASGGAGDQIERRFGRFVNGRFDPMAGNGGSLRQLFTLGTWENDDGVTCRVPLEQEPAGATVHNVGRLTTPLFGLGLVDAMPDSFFADLAAREPAATRGLVNMVSVVLPNPADPSQAVGSMRVGRFGWKGGVSNLVQFAADAYVNEMGITTQHCIGGASVMDFGTESAPNGRPMADGCDDGLPGMDDAVGDCAGGLTEIQDDVAEFATFMTFLAPPARTAAAANDTRGQALFTRTGCADCHTDRVFRTPEVTPNGVPGGMAFRPYSDFLVHDMGTLGDQIGNAGDAVEVTRRMRTAPLWGLRFRTLLLHDGRTSSVAAAIRAHDGQGARARNAFNGLGRNDQSALVRFVQSL